MRAQDTLLISRKQVAKLMTVDDCIEAVESAFLLYGEGKAPKPGILGIHVDGGGFHTKAGTLNLDRDYFVTKTNANFPSNPSTNGLPTTQGVVSVFDAKDGRLLAVMDSIELTILRTGAATAVAAKYLARPESKTITICGCGNQGNISLLMLSRVFRTELVFAYDIDPGRALTFADEASKQHKIQVTATTDLAAATRKSDICVTCTTSRKPVLKANDLAPGSFIAAVGADSDDKQELEPGILAGAKVVTDITPQCATIGELHHAIQAGILRTENVYAELGEVVAGLKPGRESNEEIIVFDSTGMALQDVATAAIVYERALKSENILKFNLGEQ